MLTVVSGLLVLVTLSKNGQSAPTTTIKSEKPLFVPSMSNPIMVHSTLYGVGSASNNLPPVRNNPAVYEFADVLQRQPSYPSFERVLQNFLHHRGQNTKRPENTKPADEDDYERNANNLQYSEQQSPEFEDLDRKYKRSTTYVSWNPPHAKTSVVSAEGNQALVNSRAVNGRPYPYTTWLPYYDSPKKNVNLSRRRRHDSEGNDNDNEDENSAGSANTPPSLFQYAPAYNTYTFPNQFEPYHINFVRDMPLQYSVVYEPAYRTSDNLAWLTNSLNTNPNSAHPDEFEKFSATY